MSNTLFDNNIIDDNDQTRARASHLEEIKNLVGNAYPNKFSRLNVTETPEGEDTITSVSDAETLKRIVGDEAFGDAFTLLMSKVKAGERPTPEELEPINARLSDINLRVSGRLATPPRVMGKVAFVHLSDGKERLQIYVRKQEAQAISNDSGQSVEEFESGWKLFQLLDHGDFVGVEGALFLTKTGELSVHVKTIQFLSKALLPMPDKLHGINDPEIRQRQRYADLIASSLKVETGEEEAGERELTTREVFVRRSKIITTMRRHLDDHGYIEVETPMLSPIASGAAATPFETFHKALGIPLYLRIAPELYLKRLVVGGFERAYELNRNFRNEGISTRHNPEFTMLEFYTAYKDVNWMIDFCEEMIRTTMEKVTGGTRIRFGAEEFDFSHFNRLTMKEAIDKYLPDEYKELGIEPYNKSWLEDSTRLHRLSVFLKGRKNDETPAVSNERMWQIADDLIGHFENKTVLRDEALMAREIVEIFEIVVEEHLSQPTFITDFPKPISPLSKASPDNPAIAERFELYIAGMEVANGFSELNDPAEQYERFKDQTKQRESGDDEAMQMDEDYVKALAYGMPPAAGIGIGIDRLTMLLTNRRSIRDVILFPHMRPKARAEASDETEKTDTSDEETNNS
jgi:lysyl-tRNA synthetase class 2